MLIIQYVMVAIKVNAMKYITMAAIAGILIGCTDGDITNVSASPDIQSVCPDDGPVLAITGICAGRSVNYLNLVGGETPLIPDDCHWAVNETQLPAGEVLLYRAAQCKGKTAKLEFNGGAHFASLTLDWSAIANESSSGTELILMTSADLSDPHKNILLQAQDDLGNTPQSQECHVRPANLAGWPSDALIVDTMSAEDALLALAGGPRSACGRFGLDEDNTSYWRVFQGFSWWFQFSQDAYQDIDPASLTIIAPDGSNGWMTVE